MILQLVLPLRMSVDLGAIPENVWFYISQSSGPGASPLDKV